MNPLTRLRCSTFGGCGLSLPLLALLALPSAGRAQTPSPSLLVLEKVDNNLAIVDPANLKIVGGVPAGPDPHEIVASPDGKFAFISNYGGRQSAFHTISVVDLLAQKALPAIDLGPLRGAHGLDFVQNSLYFTAEVSKAIGRINASDGSVDWVLGTGQNTTHMIVVSKDISRIFTSDVTSGTITLIEADGSGGWNETHIPSGRGSEGFDVSPDGKEIWAANAQDATVTIIDVAARKATQTFAIPVRGNRLKFTLDGRRVLVAGGASGSSGANLIVLDAATHNEVKRFDFGGGSAGILMVPDGSRAFVAVSAKDKVAAIDLKTLEVTGYIATGRGPDGLAWAVPR